MQIIVKTDVQQINCTANDQLTLSRPPYFQPVYRVQLVSLDSKLCNSTVDNSICVESPSQHMLKARDTQNSNDMSTRMDLGELLKL